MIIWITGLAGAGKTTIGKEIYKKLKVEYPNTVFLDGDIIRDIMGNDLGHTNEDREKNGWRICKLCKHLDAQNIHVVACILSNFQGQRDWNRGNFSEYKEVYIDVPMDVLVERNQKGLYSDALAGKVKNVVGVDIPFNKPLNPDVVIDNSENINDFELLAQNTLEQLNVQIF